jgi:propanol-preferring alcohol dehydrogenase
MQPLSFWGELRMASMEARMPAFDYDKLLWGERQIRSVANMTRQDARDFIALAHDLNFRPRVVTFSLEDANKALEAVKHETEDGSEVIAL